MRPYMDSRADDPVAKEEIPMSVLDELRHVDKLPKAIREAESALVAIWQVTARAADEIERLRKLITDHNEDAVAECNGKKGCGYLNYRRRCPRCPMSDMIDLGESP